MIVKDNNTKKEDIKKSQKNDYTLFIIHKKEINEKKRL
jgi:hypothetical protein